MVGVLLLGAAHVAAALQVGQASVAGTVRDEITGRAVAGVEVRLADLDRTAYTGASGAYRLEGVPPGPQHVVVERLGYEASTLHVLVPATGVVRVDVVLRSRPIALEGVTARPPVALRGSDGGSGGASGHRGLSAAALRNHPLLAEPDPFQALTGGEVVATPEVPSGLHVRGAGSDQVAWELDGIPVLAPYHAAGLFSAWNPDALARIDLVMPGGAPGSAPVLAGVVRGASRAPGARAGARGAVSSQQARMTVDAPLPGGVGAGFLASARSGFPGFPAPADEPSYVRAEVGDLLATARIPLGGGWLRAVGYSNEDEVTVASSTSGVDPAHRLGWQGGSLGLGWEGPARARATARVVAWRAGTEATGAWQGGGERPPARLHARRRDHGALFELVRATGPDSGVRGGLRLDHVATRYRAGDEDRSLVLDGASAVVSGFVGLARPLGTAGALELASTWAVAGGETRWSPRLRLGWEPAPRLALSLEADRSHQYAQSLRNPESVVRAVFPPELFVVAERGSVPVGRSDQVTLEASVEARPGVRLEARGWARESEGLALVAPVTEGPFATAAFVEGKASARGASVALTLATRRHGVVASWGWQDVVLRHPGGTWIPEHGARHLAELGWIAFPTSTFSLRLGAVGAFGRRATPATGALEWESCNALDRGCEFAGTPGADLERLGGIRLPPYLRLDLGVRKHWHVRIGGRDAEVGAYGSVTNLFGRENLLTRVTDPATGTEAGLGMRPLAPLVVGLDWRF